MAQEEFNFDFETDEVAPIEDNILQDILQNADHILVKKLSNNDRDWARFSNKHQAGIYIPADRRDSGFFPSLVDVLRPDQQAASIREVFIPFDWPQITQLPLPKPSRLVHYSSKGQETHLTRLPKSCFAELFPSSYLVIGRYGNAPVARYQAITVNSNSEDRDTLISALGLNADFLIGEFAMAELRARDRDLVLEFADALLLAWQNGDLKRFARDEAFMPKGDIIAQNARAVYLQKHGIADLNPFLLARPGDVLREISRDIEWEMFRDYQRRERAVALVRILFGDQPEELSQTQIIRRLITHYEDIDREMLSASQQRKSRAGQSFEFHIEAMLKAAHIPFKTQVRTKGKRLDFLLSVQMAHGPEEIILSAKTTLRERWNQVQGEMMGRKLYLVTVDDNIPNSAIETMHAANVQLIIPETLMDAKETEYKGHPNVITMRDFCDNILAPL